MENTTTFWTLILLIIAAQGLFFAIAQLFIPGVNRVSRVFLGLIILFFSIVLFENVLWMFGYINDFPHFIAAGTPIPFILGPLAYLYYQSIFERVVFKGKMIIHFVPFLLILFYFSGFYLASTASKLQMLEGTKEFRDFFTYYIGGKYIFVGGAISLLIYTFFVFHHFFRNAAILAEVRKWFQLSFFTLAFYVFNYILFHLLSMTGLISGCSFHGVSAASAFFILLFSWFGMIRPKLFDGYPLSESMIPENQVKYRTSVLTTDAEAELYVKLEKYMSEDKAYRKENISLELFASELGTTRNSLSQVINNKARMNFFEYVNHWRIEEAKKLLVDEEGKNLNIIEIAYSVGYNNKVSFNKSFKRLTGLTPTEFRKVSGRESNAGEDAGTSA